MKLSTGKVVTEGKEVKEIWQQYTEELYRRDPNATDSFNENIYEDEPEVMEIEVKEVLRHISNRKSAGCDGIPIELLNLESESEIFIRSYSRPRRPLLRPYLVTVAEATWKNKKY